MKILRHWKGILVVVLIIALMKQWFYYKQLRADEKAWMRGVVDYRTTMCGSQAEKLFDRLYEFDAEHGKSTFFLAFCFRHSRKCLAFKSDPVCEVFQADDDAIVTAVLK